MGDHLDRLFEGRPEKLSPTEAAEILGITTQGLYGWLRDGIVPAYKMGKTWIILRDDLEETIRAGTNQPGHQRTRPTQRDRPDRTGEGAAEKE